jgi:hypothetical protein
MGGKILLKRGPSTNLMNLIPMDGEILYTTDTNNLYVGDGETPGGNPLIVSSGVQKRNTVLYGPTSNSTGLPSIFTSNGLILTIDPTTVGISIAFSNGFDKYGPVDYVFNITNVASIILESFTHNYIYAQRNPLTGNVTLGVTKVPPKYESSRSRCNPNIPIIPMLTSDTQPYGTTLYNAIYSAGYEGWRAFDRIPGVSASSRWVNQSTIKIGYLGFNHIAKRCVKRYRVCSGSGYTYPSSFTLQGFDGSTWIDIIGSSYSSQVFSASEYKYYDCLSNTTEYFQHRLNITASTGAAETNIFDLQFYDVLQGNFEYFNTNEMISYSTDDTKIQKVYLGEAITDDDSVVFTRTYPYRGEFDSGWLAASYQTYLQLAHNMGIDDYDIYTTVRTNNGTFPMNGYAAGRSGTDYTYGLMTSMEDSNNITSYYSDSDQQLLGALSGIRFRIRRLW